MDTEETTMPLMVVEEVEVEVEVTVTVLPSSVLVAVRELASEESWLMKLEL